MRVPANDYLDPGSDRIEIEFLHVVEHVYAALAQFDQFHRRQLCARAGSINVAANCGYRSELAKLVEYDRIAHISGVEDVGHTG